MQAKGRGLSGKQRKNKQTNKKQPVDSLISDFSPLGLYGDTLMLFKPPGPWWFGMEVLANSYTV